HDERDAPRPATSGAPRSHHGPGSARRRGAARAGAPDDAAAPPDPGRRTADVGAPVGGVRVSARAAAAPAREPGDRVPESPDAGCRGVHRRTRRRVRAAVRWPPGAGESQANRRYLYFARIADIEGFPDIAGLYKDTADAETGHAFGHLDFLKQVGDPATGEPIGKTEANLKASVAGETYEYTQMYPAWPRPHAARASTSWRSGSRRWPRPRSRTPGGSPRVFS